MSDQLYRMYDKDGLMLYVGISKSAIRRLTEHVDDQPWVLEIATVTIETFQCTRSEMLEIERRVIIDERPKYNVIHNRSNAPVRSSRWMCESCGASAHYLQASPSVGVWHSVCKKHDLFADPLSHLVYWFDVETAESNDDIEDWERHLSEKDWFHWRGWHLMKDRCLDGRISDGVDISAAEGNYKVGRYVIVVDQDQLTPIIRHAGRIRSVEIGLGFSKIEIRGTSRLYQFDDRPVWVAVDQSHLTFSDKDAFLHAIELLLLERRVATTGIKTATGDVLKLGANA